MDSHPQQDAKAASDEDEVDRPLGPDRWFTATGLLLVLAGTFVPFVGSSDVDVSRLTFAKILVEGFHQRAAFIVFVTLAVAGMALALLGKYRVALVVAGFVSGLSVASVTIAAGLLAWAQDVLTQALGPEADFDLSGGL